MSVWADIHRRSNGVQERKEDQLEETIKELKKKVDAAAKEYVEACIDAFLEEWTEETVENFQNHYQEMINMEDDYIVERLDKEDQDLWWELAEEYDLDEYPTNAFWRIADEIIPALEVEEEDKE